MKLDKRIGGGYYLEYAEAVQAKSLTSFGKFARYLLITAIEIYVTQQKNKEGARKLSAIRSKAFDVLDTRDLAKMGVSKEVLRRNMDSESIRDVYMSDISRWYRAVIKEDPNTPSMEKQLFNKTVTFLRAGSDITDSALRSVERLAWASSTTLGNLFNKVVRLGEGEEDDSKYTVAALYKRLRYLVKKITGSASLKATPDEIREYKSESPAAGTILKEYRQTVRKISDLYSGTMKDVIGSSLVDPDVLTKKLKRLGYVTTTFPTSSSGFDGKIGMYNGVMSLYTVTGKRIQGLIPPTAKVTMNKAYNPEEDNAYILSYLAPNAKTQTRVYTMDYKNQANEKKFVAVNKNINQVNKWLSSWRRDLKAKDPARYIPAAAAYVLYYTGARVGSRLTNASLKGAEQTYGIITLRAKHLRVTGTSATLTYVGKKGSKNKHILKPKDQSLRRVIAILKELKDGKKPNELLWCWDKPKVGRGKNKKQALNSAMFRRYLVSSGVSIKTHGFRHIRGSELTRQLLATVAWKPNPKDAKTLAGRQRSAETYVKVKILTKVGQLLGHSSGAGKDRKIAWRTSIQSYINPNIVAEFFETQKLDVPKWVPKKISEE